MGIDLQYLLFLQNLRNATGGFFDEIFNGLSKTAVDLLPFLIYIIFWAVNKNLGYRAVWTFCTGEVLNGVIKLTVCAYRPWIRSELIEPAGDSKVAATGYSFPSGHTLIATMVYGMAYFWQKNKRKGVAILCIVLILLTGFSRNFLGVHTPQDVLVGMAEGFFVIWLIGLLMKKWGGNEKLLDLMTLVGVFLIAAVLLYVTQKPYPMDYVDGKLLVNPQSMMNDTFKACGQFLGFLAGSYIERHYIHYEVPTGSKSLPLMAVIGFVIMFAWKNYFAPATFVAWMGGHWGHLVARFLMVLFALTIWPIVIRNTVKSESEE